MPLYKKEIYPAISIAIWEISESADELVHILAGKTVNLEKLEFFKNENRKREWLACRAALSEIVDEDTLIITYDQNNKPHLKKHFISFSHSKNYAVASTSKIATTAVDIERFTDKILNIRHKFLSEDEIPSLTDPEIEKKLILFWSAKESLYKYYSKGQLDFAKNIKIAKTPINKKGKLAAEIYKQDFSKNIEVFYEFHEHFVLTYIIE